MGVAERYEENKKKKPTSNSGVADRYKAQNAQSVEEQLNNRVNSWLKNNEAFYNSYTERYKNGNSSYRSDSTDWLNSVSKQKRAFDDEATGIESLLDEYKEFFSPEYVRQVKNALNTNRRAQSEIVTNAVRDNEFWSGFKTEQAYNDFVNSMKAEQDYLDFDIKAGYAEIGSLQDLYDTALGLQQQQDRNMMYDPNNPRSTEEIKAANAKLQAQFDELIKPHGSLGNLKNTIAEKSAYLNRARYKQEGHALESVSDPNSENYDPNFSTYANKGASIKNPTPQEADDGVYGRQFDWWKQGEEIKNIVTYSRDNLEFVEGSEVDPENSSKGRSLYQYMTEDEVGIYNYYLGKGDTENAEKYLKSIEETLNGRESAGIFKGLEGKPLLEYVFGVAAGFDQFASGMKNLFSTEDYIPVSAIQQTSGLVREDLADDGFKIFGSSIGQAGYDAITTTTNMLPSILVGAAANYVAPGSGQIIGAALLGASAAGNSYAEALRYGFDKGQARAYSAMVGASEAGISYLLGGISALGGKVSGNVMTKVLSKVDNAFARVALQTGGNMLSEGIEESLQEILDPWFKHIATGVNYDAPDIDQVLYSGLLGALSAGVLEGGSNVATKVGRYNQVKQQGKDLLAMGLNVDRLKALGSTFSADTVAYKLANKVDAKTGAYKIAKLFNDVGAELTASNQADIVKSLTQKGVAETHAKTIAENLAAVVAGAELNTAQKAALEQNTAIGETIRDVIINPNSTVNQRVKQARALFGDTAKTTAQETAVTEETTATATVAAEEAVASVAEDNSTAVIKTPENGQQNAGTDARTIRKDTGEAIEVDEIQSIENGRMTLRLKDGKTIDSRSVEFNNQSDAVLYETVQKMDVNAAAANALIKAYDGVTDIDAYSHGIQDAFRYGKYNFPEADVASGEFTSMLAEFQRNTAYRLGQQAAETENARKARKVKGKGTVTYFSGIDTENLSQIQTTSIETMKRVSETIGVNVHLYESKPGPNNIRYFIDENGKRVMNAPHGYYKNGEIYIDINAGLNGEGAMLFAFSHELAHHLRAKNKAQFKRLADFLMQEYGKKGVSVEELVQKQLETVKQTHPNLSYNEQYDIAYEEFVADSLQTMFTDGNLLEKLEKLKAKDKGLWETIKEFVAKLVEKIRKAYKGVDPYSEEGKIVSEMKDSIEQIAQLFAEGLASTSANFQSDMVAFDADTQSAAPIMFSERTWTASEYVQQREKTAKALAKELKIPIEAAYKYIDDINSIAHLIADDRVRLDYEPNMDDGATVLKPNSEYKYTVDMSTLCAKRLLFTGTFDAIQRMLPDTAFDSDDIVRLRDMMQKRGLEVACGICYVESTRREIGRITQEFIERYKIAQKTGKPISRINSKGEEVTLSVKGKVFHTEDGYTPNLGEMNTTDIDIVKRDHREVYEAYLAFMNARGQAKPKLLETRAEYKGEILKHFKAKSAVNSRNAHGGLRLQSFSDFEVPHMIDMMQVIMDMSRVGLKSQAYTKVPAFADVFGGTGVKINLSLIAKGSGLDANGNLIFDDVEGINHEEAFRLREKYSNNVGTILVGKSKAHIIAAMADPRIDFIIPFHKSSWKESLYEALGLTGYEDFTESQNEKPIDPNRKISNFDPSEYWDFSKTGDENAEIYLQRCREDGRTPKFPEFIGYPGYWKLLIDFKMYNNEGIGVPQEVVHPDFDMDAANSILSEYKGGHRSFPVAKDVVSDFVAEYKNGIRYSTRKSDADYIAAVNRGDMDAAQAMVDKAARSAGYTIRAYHGTNSEFTVFDKKRLGKGIDQFGAGFYFASKRGTARSYGTKMYNSYLKIQNPIRIKSTRDSEGLYEVRISKAQAYQILKRHPLMYDSELSPLGQFYEEYWNGGAKDWMIRDLASKYDTIGLLDGDPFMFKNFPNELHEAIRDVMGYDGVMVMFDYGDFVPEGDPDYYYVAWFDNQMKSSEPVVYDDGGEVIPLSERFNEGSNDIRYSQRRNSGYSIDNYTEEQYNAFGWASYNNVITADERETLLSRFADFRHNRDKYPVTRWGEVVVHSSECPDVIMYVKDTIKHPTITRVVRIMTTDKETVAEIREEIICNEGKHLSQPYSSVEGVYGYGILSIRKARDYASFLDAKAGTKRGSIQESTTSGEGLQNRGRSSSGSSESLRGDGSGVKLSSRKSDGLSNRALLANALESTATDEESLEALRRYKEDFASIDKLETELLEIYDELDEIYETKGRGITAEVKALKDKAARLEARITNLDKELIRAETGGVLATILKREKAAVSRHYQDARKRNTEGRHKTIVRNKIKRTVKELDRLLNRGNRVSNVKNEARDTVSSALRLSDLLFSEEITNEYIVLAGAVSANDAEKKLLAEYAQRIKQRNGATSDEVRDLAVRRIALLNKKLADLFARERAIINNTSVKKALSELSDAYGQLKSANSDYVEFAYEEAVHERLKSFIETLDGTTVKDMSLNQLEEILLLYRTIEYTVRESNSLFKKGQTLDRAQTTAATQKEILSWYKHPGRDPLAIVRVPLNAVKGFAFKDLKPVAAFETLGSETYMKFFWDAIKAEGEWARIVDEAATFLDEQVNKSGYTSWNMEERHTFTLPSGQEFNITLQDMMSIYAYSKRDQAYGHMTVGGFQFPENSTYEDVLRNKKGEPIKGANGKEIKVKRIHLSDTYVVDNAVLAQIIKELEDMHEGKVKAYVDAVQSYITEVLAAKGNEVSRVLFGIDLFGEKAYMPLKSSSDFLTSTQTVLGKTQTVSSLKNIGMSKATVPNAENPIVLQGFDQVVQQHIDEMAKYCAYVLPIENLRRVFDSVAVSDNGREYISTKNIISRVHGKGVSGYFEKYITDLNGGTVVADGNNLASKMFSNFKAVSVAASMSVVVQQPFAVTRAMAMISPKYFAFGENSKTDASTTYEEIKRYAPIAIIKAMGGFDMGNSRTAVEYLQTRTDKGIKRGFDEVRDKSMWMAGKADEFGWGIIWDAVKREMADKGKLTPGTEAFFEACGERFTEVIVYTQVYDSVNSRSGFMRSQNDTMKYWTSFMGEPTTTINMAYLALLRFARATKAERAKALGGLTKVTGVLLVNSLLTTLAKSLVYAMRDDEDDEAFLEKWAKHFGDNVLSDLNPLNMLPFVRDIMSIIEGWDVERPDTTLISALVLGIKNLLDGDASVHDWHNFAGAVGNMIGLPVKNVIRDANGIINLFEGIFDDIHPNNIGGAFVEGITGKDPADTDKLYRAIVTKDTGRLAVLKGKYKSDEAYNSALKKAIREYDPRIKKAASALMKADYDSFEAYISQIAAEGFFDHGFVEDAIRAEASYFNGKIGDAYNAKEGGNTNGHNDIVRELRDRYRGIISQDEIVAKVKAYTPTEETEETEQAESIFKTSDINAALESGNTSKALEIIDDLIKVKTENYIAKGEKKKDAESKAKSSVKSSVTSYWKHLYQKAYLAGDTNEMSRIAQIIKGTKLYTTGLSDTLSDWRKSAKDSK